jgi:hypothetical protein
VTCHGSFSSRWPGSVATARSHRMRLPCYVVAILLASLGICRAEEAWLM